MYLSILLYLSIYLTLFIYLSYSLYLSILLYLSIYLSILLYLSIYLTLFIYLYIRFPLYIKGAEKNLYQFGLYLLWRDILQVNTCIYTCTDSRYMYMLTKYCTCTC